MPQAMDSFIRSFPSQRFAEINLPYHRAYASTGRWTTPEDALLITAVRRHGRHWYKVAEILPGRTDDQCAKRWREKLDPSIRQSSSSWPSPLLNACLIGRDAWTEAEDLKLLEALEKHGKRWNIISGSIKGRPAVQCRNRFLSLQRAGKVTGDGKAPGGTGADPSTASGTKVTILHTQEGLFADTFHQIDAVSDQVVMDVDTEPKSSISSAAVSGSPSSPSPCPSTPDSLSSAELSLPASDPISTTSSPLSASMDGLESARIPTNPQGT